MWIGLDFDNTIVSYDALFHKVAEEQGHIPSGLPRTKLAVRDYLRSVDREPVWTEMQGYVYGARIMEANAFPGVVEFLRQARDLGVKVSIVSHKTRHPFMGPQYDLHKMARRWVEHYLADAAGPLMVSEHVHFEPTKDDKLRRIGESGFTFFVDDLPEILSATAFPESTLPVLFDPARTEILPPRAVRAADWGAVQAILKNRCTATT